MLAIVMAFGHSPASAASQVPAEDQRFEAMVAASDEAALRLAPMTAVGRGDLRWADQFGDLVTDRYFRALEANTRRDYRNLQSIRREQLSPAMQIAYDVFAYQTTFALRSFDNGVQRLLQQFPIDDYTGLHLSFPQWSSGEDVAPFKTSVDYRNGRERLLGYARYLQNVQAQLGRSVASRHTMSAHATRRLIQQLGDAAAQAKQGDSPFLKPTSHFPATMSPEDRSRFTVQYRQALRVHVAPALESLQNFLSNKYLPASRTGAPGLSAMPDGDPLYRYWLEYHTTTTRSAEEIHQLGLAEVARIQQEMEAVKSRVGFSGSLTEFFQFLRTDPRFKPHSDIELLAAYRAIDAAVRQRLPTLFRTLPKSALEIRAVPLEQAATVGGAYYVVGTPDGSRPGIFYVNTTNLASRTSPSMTALFLHEGIPGHHLQGSLTQENTALPKFLRFGWNTGYGEGWALYAESLGMELELYSDPYQYMGRLDLEMFRALRLVVDTGLHAKHWTRAHAIDYMAAHSSLDRRYIEQEVDRYLAWPGQATAYKLGEIVLRELRQRAASALGERFDVRDFHQQVLNTGCLPLHVLEQKIDRWIVAMKADAQSNSRVRRRP